MRRLCPKADFQPDFLLLCLACLACLIFLLLWLLDWEVYFDWVIISLWFGRVGLVCAIWLVLRDARVISFNYYPRKCAAFDSR